eukprot:2066899-Pleurochrysis_carterae.AAC.1
MERKKESARENTSERAREHEYERERKMSEQTSERARTSNRDTCNVCLYDVNTCQACTLYHHVRKCDAYALLRPIRLSGVEA